MPESVARRRIDWGVLSVEAAAIFLSVLLGFAVTEWRQARAEARTVDQALAAYADEVEANQRVVAQAFAYHGALHDQLQRVEPEVGETLFDALNRVAGWQGPRQVTFRDGARAAAEATGVLGLLPFESTSVLVGLYDTQDRLDEIERGFSDAAFDPAMFDGANARAAFVSLGAYFSRVVEQEANLLRTYRVAIETLGLDLQPAADSLLTDR